MKKRITLLVTVILCIASLTVGVFAKSIIEEIKAQLRPDFTIIIDGEEQTFKTADGEKVYPVLYEGTTYLPIRAIGEMMGKTVYWYEEDKTIEFKDKKSTVTDADVIVDKKDETPTVKPDKTDNEEKPTEKPADKKFIGIDKAKSIALKKANLKASEVTFLKAELDADDGVWKYEVEFKKGITEYEADIHAETGTIMKFEKDIND